MLAGLWGAPQPTAAELITEEDVFWYERPSKEQSDTLTQFRADLEQSSLLVPNHDDDCTLLRFLMARDWDVERATAMYRDMQAWRRAEGADELYGSDPNGEAFPEMKQLLKVYPHFTCNTDKFGRPVYIELLGRTDATALFETITTERLIRYHIWTWERYLRRYLPACSAAAGRTICTTTVIIDLAGLSLAHFNTATQKLLNTFSKIDQDYYPEHLGTMFVINTPLIFRGIWAAVQPLLQERTRKKIIILGSDYLTEVAKVVPLENLPTILGGKVEVDEEFSSVGPWANQQHQQGEPQGRYASGARREAGEQQGAEGGEVDVAAEVSLCGSGAAGAGDKKGADLEELSRGVQGLGLRGTAVSVPA